MPSSDGEFSTKPGGPVQPARAVQRPLAVGEIAVTGGFWADLQDLNAAAVIGHCRAWLDRSGWIANFDRAAGVAEGGHEGVEFVDSEVYKLLEAMAWELGRRRDPLLAADYADLVRRVAAAQSPDGYLHTAFGGAGQPARYSDLAFGHELYCFGHLLQAAVARLRTGHDDLLVDVARGLAEHLYREFGPLGRDAVCGHPEIEMALVEFSRATGDGRLLELARLLVERRGRGLLGGQPFGSEYFQDDLPVRSARVLRGHAVRALYLASGALDVATDLADAELADVVAEQWSRTVARRTYVTGGMGSRRREESFGDDFELPPDRAYSETCAGIASIMLSWRLLLATGEAKYADLIERTLFNNVLASPAADGRAFFYANPLHQRVRGAASASLAVSHRTSPGLRAPWFDVSCCPTNVARLLASAPLYFATTAPGSITLHQYGTYRVRVKAPGGEVSLTVQSDYPADGRVVVRIDDAPATELALRLRVPPWAQWVMLDGDRVARPDDGYLVVSRAFAPGDRVTMELPMTPRVIWPDRRIDAIRGTFAVERGPDVLAVESVDLPQGWDVDDVVVDPGSLDGDTTVEAQLLAPAGDVWPYGGPPRGDLASERVRVPLVAYRDWANRGASTMRVWLPRG